MVHIRWYLYLMALTPCNIVFLGKLLVAQLLKDSLPLVEPEGSTLNSQEPVSGQPFVPYYGWAVLISIHVLQPTFFIMHLYLPCLLHPMPISCTFA
jgi:hypothetical protein